ncbi:AAA family ATPase [Bradyrhizobium sp. WYCCWR 13023]|uniref:AAA family ATPase n=1 Tax=Bradyrhizobium zhengyangense TaxID=2911009 RepID=A0A9X1R7E1_9BRAD|nr:adenylate/guanylate cyclase domain-containing protein [Bradyrhizobium zhengyangense]MCG2627201.1 AAA family ATPase [Bradyrhizobium zhengyangense]MCG2642141.1 AAA family ATPase [Bradyrhizobium zhengyangense]MCG2667948.1 AAA family ATPase [Bradyrhizobium zhengyangense]
MHCFACQSAIDPDDSWCSKCGAAVRQRVDPDSERRFVTILRADVIDSTGLVAELEPEDAVSRLEPALAAMRASVRQFGGIVSKELGDGLAAVFGAPIADDNHAPLACHAAIELVRRVASLGDPGLQVRVGLHSGHVVAYMVASEFSKVYEIGGAAQHLAARLEQVAEANQIYVSEACQNLADGHVRFEHLGSKSLRGFSQPVPVYRIVGASDLSSWRVRRARSVSRFVDRAIERALLDRSAGQARAGRQTVLLLGDAGIGKSRLAHEFAQKLKGEGWRLIDAECSPNLQGAPFSTLKRILLSAMDAAAKDPGNPRDPRAELSTIQQSALDAVLDVPISNPQWDELEPHARGRVISDASCAVIQSVASRQPTLLLLEDLHWIDRASDVVVAAIAALAVPGLLVLLTTRPNGMPVWIARCHAEVVAMRPLDDDSGLEMLSDMLGSSQTNADLKSRIISHTANVPLFIEEVCRGLKDSGTLRGEWGDLALMRPIDELGIPTSIQGVIAARLDRVSRQQRLVLQVAAALGPRSSEAVVRKVSQLAEDVLQDCLVSLDRAELLVRIDSDLENSLEFRHEMVRQVTYESMVEKVRESIHARVLAAFESDETWRDDPDALCYHAMRAKDWAKAFNYGRSAAQKCLARSAYADAVDYFRTAMNSLDKTPLTRPRETNAIDLRMEARMAFQWSGRVAEWIDLGKEADQRASQIDDVGRKIAAMTVMAGGQNFYGTPAEAVVLGEEVVGLAEQSGNPGWRNLAQYNLGQAYFLAGRYREAEQTFARARAHLMEPEASAPYGTPPKYTLLLCCMMKSFTHTVMGEFDAAEQLQREAAAIADETGRPHDRVAAASGSGWLMLGRGDPAAAAAVLEGGLVLAQKHGIRLFVPVLACHLGMAYLEQGLFDRARRMLTEAREEARAVGYTSAVLRSSIYLALAVNQLGDVRAAQNMLREARNTARQQGFSGLEAEALFGEAVVTPPASGDNRTIILAALRAAIAIASESGARPLREKAEAMLDRMFAGGDQPA